LIPVTADLTRTVTSGEGLRADIDGPLFSLPAGAIRVRAGAGIDWTRLAATRSSGIPSERSRSATTLQAGITVPLTSVREDVLSDLGDIEASADIVRIDFSDLAVLTNWSTELNWQFRPWIRFGAGFNRTRTAPDVEVLSAPVIIYPNVRIFDPVREETVDVAAITGGNPALRPQTVDVTRLSIGAAPLPKYNLQLQFDYTMSESRNLLGGLPPTSAAVVAAFPARYQRDATGRLITIDSRAINFERQDQNQLRYAATFTVPLYPRPSGEGAERALPAGPRPTIEFGASHTILLKNRILVAAGLPEIDLLREGASGIGGSRPRHLIEGGVSLSDRGTGVRLSVSWRSPSSLLAGTEFDPQRIRFGSLAIFDLRVFAETSRFFPDSDGAKGGRVSLVLQIFANTRQKVTDSTGSTPLSYQPAYRDPIGRTVMVELRKAF
jgi:iron complex outermembrane recepter protein